MTRVLITRQDGTRRVVEVSRSGKVKSDLPACETCQGSGVSNDDRIGHARRTLARWADNCANNGNDHDAGLYRDALRLLDGTDDDYIQGLKSAACGACQALRKQDLDAFLSGGLVELPLPSRSCPKHGGTEWPAHDWDYASRGAMTCRNCGVVWSDVLSCSTECDGEWLP